MPVACGLRVSWYIIPSSEGWRVAPGWVSVPYLPTLCTSLELLRRGLNGFNNPLIARTATQHRG